MNVNRTFKRLAQERLETIEDIIATYGTPKAEYEDEIVLNMDIIAERDWRDLHQDALIYAVDMLEFEVTKIEEAGIR